MRECKVLIILFLFLPVCFFAQLSKAQIFELKKAAEFYENAQDYYLASDYYFKYCNLKPSDIDAAYRLAENYRLSRDYHKAREWYFIVCERASEKYPLATFRMAQMLKQTARYDQAVTYFEQFINLVNERPKLAIEKQWAIIEKQGCYMAMSLNKPEAEETTIITHLDNSVNHAHIDFSPIFIDDETMLYASFDEQQLQYYESHDSIAKKRQFYTAKKVANNWEGSKSIQWPLNDPDQDVGNASISEDQKRIYFSKCKKSTKGYACKIYLTKMDDDLWSDPKPLKEIVNDDLSSNTQPSVYSINDSIDAIIFSSNRSGGLGGFDLWKVTYNHKEDLYSDLENLGSKINTNLDEQTPFFDNVRNTLYFSSNGWEGIGGFDVFKSSFEQHQWGFPENLSYPICSSADDLYFTKSTSDSTQGFLVSNRDGSIDFKHQNCCDDIYHIEMYEHRKVKYASKLYNTTAIDQILEMEDELEKQRKLVEEKYVLVGQSIDLYQFKGNENPVKIASTITDEKGGFEFDLDPNNHYKIVINRDGFFNKHHKVDPSKASDHLLQEHIGVLELTLDPIVIKDIYYPFDSDQLTGESTKRVDSTIFKVLEENPELIIELASHTDNLGTDKYNDNLSQKRAETIVRLLTRKGIEPKRLRAKGYGERRPIAPNTYSDGTDNPSGRAKNRRTEFRVVGIYKNGAEILYDE